MSFMDAAPTIFACFDQPDLKAPYTFHVRAPQDWVVIGNAPGRQVEPGVWELEQSQPLSTYFVTLVAGPYHVLRDEHDGIPLGLSARASIAADLDKDADELFTLTRQSFDELHRLFGIRYPFGDYHQAFVPEFNAGAMENPGCVTFRDPLVFTSRVTRGVRVARASTLAHEMAHQWFGNLVTPAWWDDLWLNESFAEYMGNRVTADVTEYADAWVNDSYARRQWGLTADQRPSSHPVAGNGAVDASAALQDFDGISYAKGCAILRQINATLGDEVFFRGTIDHFERHRFGNATMHDLFASWERAGAERHGETSPTTGCGPRAPTCIELDRAAGVIRRTPPEGHPADRPHRIRAAVAAGDGTWTDHVLDLEEPETAFDAGDRPVLLDPYHDTWALLIPDKLTMDALEVAAARRRRPELRAGVWSNVRSALHNAAVDPVDVLEIVVRSLPIEDTEDTERRTMPWVYGWVVPLQPDPAGGSGPDARGRPGQAAEAAPTSEEQLAAFRAAIEHRRRLEPCRTLAGRDELPEGIPLDVDLRWRVLAGWPRSVRWSWPSSTGSWTRSQRPWPGSGTPAPAPRCPTPAPRPGRGAASPGRSTCPTTSSRRWASASGGAARRGSPSRTSEGTSPTCRTPFRCAAAGCWPRRAEDFFPATSLTAETLARAEGLSPTATWTCPSAAGWSTKRTPRAQARGPRSLPAPMKAERRPGPTVRTRVHELAHGRRAPPRGPAGHRGAAGDPARLARRRAAARLGHDADARPRLRAGRGLAGSRRADHGSPTHHRLLHGRGPDRGAGVQRRHGDPRRAAHPGSRPPARGLRILGVRGLRQGHDRRGARGPGRGRWSGPLPAADVVRTLPDAAARAPGRLRYHRRGARGGRWPPRTASCSSCGRTSVGTTPSTRSPAPGWSPGSRPARRPWSSAAGRASSWCRRRWQRAVGALVAVGAPTSLAVELADEAGLALYGFTSGKRTVRYA